ncbi:MAG: sulfite exporter TauE/SafE family protein [Planctomycetes bacterium]|nr:sulfite exporter TauE/SafE family protein [Planctomycetota bacterium]
MPETTSLILIGVIFFLSTFARTSLGFGDALIAMPLLALFVPMTLASPIVALASALNAFLILAREWKSLEVRQAGWLIVIALSGIPFGVWLLHEGDDRILKFLLGTVVLGFAIWSLRAPSMPELKSAWWNVPFGLSAGFLGGAYNTAGPPLVIYAALKKWPPDVFRVILQAYFLPSGLLIVALHGWNGRITPDVLKTFGLTLPAIAVGFLAGRHLAERIPEERFRKTVYIVLLFLGALLVITPFTQKRDSTDSGETAASQASHLIGQ